MSFKHMTILTFCLSALTCGSVAFLYPAQAEAQSLPSRTIPGQAPLRIEQMPARRPADQEHGCTPLQGVIWSQDGRWSCMDMPAFSVPGQGQGQTGAPQIDTPAARVWVGSPYYGRHQSRGGVDYSSVISRTHTYILNIGSHTATYNCTVFNSSGLVLANAGSRRTLSPGALGSCSNVHDLIDEDPSGDRSFEGWMMVTSDQPIIVSGYSHRSIELRQRYSTDRVEIPWYQVDCNNPEGVEHVCRFAANINRNRR